LSRKYIPKDVETQVLMDSKRVCCLCAGLNNNFKEQRGQIAHIDKNNENNKENNLAWLCFNHHDKYDSTTSQSKNYTQKELKTYKGDLIDKIANGQIVTPLKTRTYFVTIILIISLITVSIIFFATNVKNNHEKEENTNIMYFAPNIPDQYNILISRFEDYRYDDNTSCVGRSIEESINAGLDDNQTNIKIIAKYIDSLDSPTSKYAASNLAKEHNADLFIYGLAKNLEYNCEGGDVCFRYNLQDVVPKLINKSIEFKTSKHDLDFITFTPDEIEKGNIQIDIQRLSDWVLGLVNLKTNNIERAYWQFDKVISDDNANDSIKCKRVLNIADTYFTAGNYEEGKILIDNFSFCESENYYFNSLKGEYYYNNGEYDSAIKYFSSSIVLNDYDLFSRYFRSKLYVDRGNDSLALEDLYFIIESYPNDYIIEALYDLAKIYFDNKDYNQAIVILTNLLSLDEEYDTALNLRSQGYLQNKDYLNSLIDIKKAIELNPNWVYYYNCAVTNYLLNDFDSAVNSINKAVSLDPLEEKAILMKAILFNKIGLNKDSIQYYLDKSLDLDSNSFYSLELQGDLKQDEKLYQEAIIFYSKAIKLDSTKSRLYNNRSACYGYLGMFQEGLLDLTKAIKIDPENAQLHFNIFQCYSHLDKYKEAYFHIKKAIKLNPEEAIYKSELVNMVMYCQKRGFKFE